ncbi:helix-turn-helix transcriptional regulator [Halorussus aquaticus]|uniref:Helix-turn-helix transcriptional regulator n=1 Tax=Halorussus aquaticus TaxID=2953748 RepID=A0ABD5Q8X2_9EURY|nr:helix-turn-helix transcriptional regulator [Halorussus aquaticus]
MIDQTAADLTSYKRDLLLAVYRANQATETPVGADVKRELEALGQTNTQGGQFYPRLNELVERTLITKNDHPDDARGFTCDLTEEGREVLTQLFVRNAISLDIDVAELDLPAEPPRPGRRLCGRPRG